MAFNPYNIRKRVFCISIFIFGIVLFLLYSLNHIWEQDHLKNEHRTSETVVKVKPPRNISSTNLFDLKFKYILTPDSCSENDVFVFIVTSHYSNVETRSSMRRGLPLEDLAGAKMRRVFLLGQSSDSIFMTQASILHESKRFGDIVQGNFQEAYRNLTYKHIMGLKWVSENCQSAKYVVKMDDDIVFNVKKMIALLNDIHLPKNSIGGYVLRDMKPIREPANKWYVTQEEYRFSKYPSFVSGWLYITTPKIASKLVLLSHYFKYFWIDDVYVTGILAKNLKIKLFEMRRYFTVYAEFLRCCISGMKKRLQCDILVGPNGGDSNLFYEFNESMKMCEFEACSKRLKPMNETCVVEKKINLRGGSGIIENYNLH